MKRTERISAMEKILDDSNAMLKEVDAALEKYRAMQEKIEELDLYYGSKEWFRDLKADEEGKLPADLKRGVLSEDGIFDMITHNREVLADMLDLAQEFVHNH
ncbi:MAG: DUF4298 domain-containing protein [Erysipelotrichales bacterium]|nr:DUF4298 domain-containing protein [Erysipelotrichales bacterium]